MTRTPTFDPRPLVTESPVMAQALARARHHTVAMIEDHPTLAAWAILIELKTDASMWDKTADALVESGMPILAATLRARATELRQIVEAAERS